ncbi:hypothetical protein [Streptomyces sp. SID161]|uniref:hypothetical protein n=1 Tax=Streptomyces sp. SID161 TaxID=2690251 RepID=UPI001371E6C5|nr:hypothetical protein [Streptomyces sp. SID161]MYW48877.1 hypothetical protein [Streptomyces sp. SID161]MYW49838.1 hypothetical protein [Streptomyces sp. SID161]
MQKRTLARRALTGTGWAHPYRTGPFDPFLYADGGDGDDSGSDSGDSADGGSDDDAGDDDAGGTGDDDTDGGGQDDQAKPKPKAPAKKGGDEDPAATIARLQKDLKAANADAAKARTTAKKTAADEARSEIVTELGKALGLIKDDDKEQAPPDPAKLTAEIERATSAHRDTARELAVYRGAAKHGADPGALTDSRKFLDSIKHLDPTEDGFSKKVSDAIKKAVDDDPKFKTAPAAPDRTSSDFNGGGGSSSEPQTIDEIRAARRKRRAG